MTNNPCRTMLAASIILCLLFTSGCGSEFEILLEEKTSAETEESSSTYVSWTEFNGLYWSETDGTINRINLDGTGREIIIESSNTPLDIAFDTNNSMVFWSEYTGSSYRICRAGFNEKNIEVVYTSSNIGPTAIAIDNSAGIIYWNEYQSTSNHHDIWKSVLTGDTLSGAKWLNELANNNYYTYSISIGNGNIYLTANTYYDSSTVLGSGNAGSPYLASISTEDSDSLITSLNGPTSDSVPFKGIATDGTYVYFAANTNHGTWPKRISRATPGLSIVDEGWIYLGVTDIQKITLDLTSTLRRIYWTSQTDKKIYSAELDVNAPNTTAVELITLDSAPTGIMIVQ